MFDPSHIPPVETDELLARFILFSKHFRPSDRSLKPDLFMPHPLPELSVTRQREATETEIWAEGTRVAHVRNKTLYGLAELTAGAFTAQELSVVSKPLIENPNHADVVNWPAEKSLQKIKALEIASRASFKPLPK